MNQMSWLCLWITGQSLSIICCRHLQCLVHIICAVSQLWFLWNAVRLHISFMFFAKFIYKLHTDNLLKGFFLPHLNCNRPAISFVMWVSLFECRYPYSFFQFLSERTCTMYELWSCIRADVFFAPVLRTCAGMQSHPFTLIFLRYADTLRTSTVLMVLKVKLSLSLTFLIVETLGCFPKPCWAISVIRLISNFIRKPHFLCLKKS